MAMWIPQEPSMAAFGQRSVRKAIEHGLTFRPLADTANATLDWWLADERSQTEQIPIRAGLALAKEQELIAKWRESVSVEANGGSE